MFSIQSNLNAVIGDFHLGRMIRYGLFIPHLCNPGKSPGFGAGRIMPSHACCSDEGFPIIPITRHSGTRVVQFRARHGQGKGNQDYRLKAAAKQYCCDITGPDSTGVEYVWIG